MTVLDATVDNRNSSALTKNTSLMKLLHTRPLVDGVVFARRKSVNTRDLLLDSGRKLDSLRLIDMRDSRTIVALVFTKSGLQRLGVAGPVALNADAGENVRVEMIHDAEARELRGPRRGPSALLARLELDDVPSWRRIARRLGRVAGLTRGSIMTLDCRRGRQRHEQRISGTHLPVRCVRANVQKEVLNLELVECHHYLRRVLYDLK